MMNNKILWLVLLLPLLFSCQEKYNKAPFDDKEKILRQFPVEDTKTMVLDSLWDKRDSLTYLRLKNLKTIAMNEVTYIPNWIGKFNETRIFLVVNEKNKKIKKIPSSIGKLSNLLEFNIQNNEVNSIPETFYNLSKIKNIELKNNKIEILSPRIGNLDSLQSFGIANNPLKYLPSEICKLNSLKFLDLDNTKINNLPKCLSELKNIDWIHVSGTELTEFPIDILDAPNLQSVQAKGLKLKNYKEVKTICEKKKINFHYDEQ